MNNKNNLKIFFKHKYDLDIKPIIFTKKSNFKSKNRPLRYMTADNGQIKHFPPSIQEWCNSIYVYDKNYSKLLPIWDKNLMNLLKSYYSMYCGIKYLKNFEALKTKHKKNRFKRRLSINKIFVGKGYLKHTSNKIFVTWYIHNRIEKNFLKKRFKIISSSLLFSKDRFVFEDKVKMLNRITWRHIIKKKQKNKNRKRELMDNMYNNMYGDISNMSNLIIKKQFKEKITFNRPFTEKEFFKYLQRFYTPKQYKIRELLLKRNLINLELFLTWWLICLPSIRNLNLNKEKNNTLYKKINNIKRIIFLLKDNIYSYPGNLILLKKNYYLKKYLTLKYSLRLNIVKSSLNTFVEKLKYLVIKIYNKKIEFKLIKLKKLFLSSDIFTQTIALRLKNRKNRLYRVLKSSLRKIRLSSLVSKTEKYKKIKIRKELVLINKIRNQKANSMSIYGNSIDLFKNLYINILPELLLKTRKELRCWTMTDIHPGTIKYRQMAGIKVEAKGRLTKRFTASRSIFKMKQKGGLKNIDSSFRGLSAVILRGHIKSNIQYSKFYSKRRNGAFGIKGWVSNK